MEKSRKEVIKKIKKPYFIEIFRSNYCKFVFLLSVVFISFLTPKKIFYGYYAVLGVLFIFVASLTLTCLVRTIKERVYSAKASGASLVSILSIIFGFGALQACTIGAPVCGAMAGGGIIALIIPGFAFNLIEKYSIWVIVFSILIQFFALYFMNCFKFSYKRD